MSEAPNNEIVHSRGCPLCGATSEFAFEAKGYRLLDCKRCAHRFADVPGGEAHVTTIYGDDYFTGGGAGYADYTADGDALRARGRMYADIIARFVSAGRLLDIGAAAGFLLKGFIDEGWRGSGLEPNPAMCDFGRERLGLPMHRGSLESFRTSERFDLITMIQVVAHFYDPRGAFENTREMLASDGLLLIETWNRDSISARLFGKAWHEYSPPSVLQWFSSDGLREFLIKSGFEYVGGGRPSKKISGAHAKSLLRYRLGDNPLLKLIPDRVKIPYPSEDLFWALFKKI